MIEHPTNSQKCAWNGVKKPMLYAYSSIFVKLFIAVTMDFGLPYIISYPGLTL